MTKKIDLRIKKTDHALKQAFWKLLLSEGFTKITVQQILDEAKVNRATFYKYYDNKGKLLDAVGNDLLSQFKENSEIARAKILADTSEDEQLQIYYQQMVKFIYQNGTKFLTLIGPDGDPSFANKLAVADETIIKQNNLFARLSIPQHYALAAVRGIAINLITEWVRSDFHETPEEFIDIIDRILSPIILEHTVFS